MEFPSVKGPGPAASRPPGAAGGGAGPTPRPHGAGPGAALCHRMPGRPRDMAQGPPLVPGMPSLCAAPLPLWPPRDVLMPCLRLKPPGSSGLPSTYLRTSNQCLSQAVAYGDLRDHIYECQRSAEYGMEFHWAYCSGPPPGQSGFDDPCPGGRVWSVLPPVTNVWGQCPLESIRRMAGSPGQIWGFRGIVRFGRCPVRDERQGSL